MRLSDIYQSRFLSAADVGSEGMAIRVISISVELLASLKKGKDNEPKIIAEFTTVQDGKEVESKKQFVIGRNNAKVIAAKLGDDTDDWLNHTYILGVAPTNYGDSIVVRGID